MPSNDFRVSFKEGVALLDIAEVLSCIERLPRAASIQVRRTAFVGGHELQVTPAVNFSALDEVMVVTGVRDGPAAASATDDPAGEGAP